MCCFNTEEMAYFSVGINPLSSPINVYFCTARGPPIIFLINNTWAWKFTILYFVCKFYPEYVPIKISAL